MKESIVLYPSPAFHHLVSLVELGKLILHHNPNFSVTILVPTAPLDSSATSLYNYYISQNHLAISFFSLPSVNLAEPNQNSSDKITRGLEFVHLNISNVVEALKTISLTSKVLALITSSIHHSYHPCIPTYNYFTSCASALANILYLPTLHNQTTKSFKDLDNTFLHIPGLPPINPSYLPEVMLDRNDQAYYDFLNVSAGLPNSKGIIMNTFDLLEPQAIKAITNGACVPNVTTPPIYCIGPLIVDAKDRAAGILGDALSNCLTWLDAQPSRSVVFLCFGSKGAFPVAQLKEIAIGLERSKQRFLWVVRNPPNSTTEDDLESLLPEGFLERTKVNGLVMKSWAPQAAILSHEAVGGFVTHCGWNSVVEAVSNGVPMVAWPLYAEQHMNSVVLVEEMKLAMPISPKEGKDVWVSAEEVEKRVRELMKLEGKGIGERSLEMKAMAKAAWTHDGSSFNAFSKLVASWKQE